MRHNIYCISLNDRVNADVDLVSVERIYIDVSCQLMYAILRRISICDANRDDHHVRRNVSKSI
jgi:hypothetical protein